MKIWKQGAFAVVVAVLLCGAMAQAQTDVALSGYGTFTTSSTGSGTHQTPSNSAGGLFEWRHIVNPLVGFEFDVTFNPANQSYHRYQCHSCKQLLSHRTHRDASYLPTAEGLRRGDAIRWKLGDIEEDRKPQAVCLGRRRICCHRSRKERVFGEHRDEAGLHLWRRAGLELSTGIWVCACRYAAT